MFVGVVVRRVSSLELGRKKQGVEVRGVDGLQVLNREVVFLYNVLMGQIYLILLSIDEIYKIKFLFLS